MGAGGLGRRLHLVEGGRRLAVGDVVAHRDREQEGLVEHHPDVGPQAGQGQVPHVVAVDADGSVLDVVEAGQQAGHGRLAGAGPTDQGHRLSRGDVQVEVGQHQLFGIRGVGEVDVLEPHIAATVDQVDGVGGVGDGGLLVDDLVDAVGRGRRPLAHHDQHAQHHERGLEHQQVGVEGQDVPDAQSAVDDHVAAEQQDQGQPHLGQVLDEGGEAGPEVGVFDVAPPQPVGRPGQRAELLLLGGEGLDHPHAVDVLVDDGGHVGQPGLDDPRHREHRLPHLDAGQVDEGHGGHGDEGQGHVDGQHEAEGHDGDGALDQDGRREGHVHLDRADVRVGPRDELAGLHPVVEGERHLGQVLVDDVPQVVLDVVGRLEEEQAGDVAGHATDQPDPDDQPDVVARGGRCGAGSSW